jgi:hypothetical protein
VLSSRATPVSTAAYGTMQASTASRKVVNAATSTNLRVCPIVVVAMSYQRIQNPAVFFRRLGGLHDAEITRFEWSGDVITMGLDDLFANFVGSPEYRGPRPSVIRFSGLANLSLALESSSSECVTVYSCDVNEGSVAEAVEVKIQLVPGGLVQMVCQTIAGDFDSSVLV